MCIEYKHTKKRDKTTDERTIYIGMPSPIENIELNGNKNSIEEKITNKTPKDTQKEINDIDKLDSPIKRKLKIALIIIIIFVVLTTTVAGLARLLNVLQ